MERMIETWRDLELKSDVKILEQNDDIDIDKKVMKMMVIDDPVHSWITQCVTILHNDFVHVDTICFVLPLSLSQADIS